MQVSGAVAQRGGLEWRSTREPGLRVSMAVPQAGLAGVDGPQAWLLSDTPFPPVGSQSHSADPWLWWFLEGVGGVSESGCNAEFHQLSKRNQHHPGAATPAFAKSHA